MANAETIKFRKMNGLGNEILVVDLRGQTRPVPAKTIHKLASDADITFDQVMVLDDPRTPGTAAFMRIYNADGSDVAACGNGTRCVAWAMTKDTGATQLALETHAGVLGVTVDGPERISVDMGEPNFAWDAIPLSEPFHDTRGIELQVGPIDNPVLHSPSVVNVGNPHAIFWVDDLDDYDLGRFGPLLENHPIFPERANISLAQVLSRTELTIKTWERGAGLTEACGSAACAAAVCASRKKFVDRSVHVLVPGGGLDVLWTDDNRIIMTGSVADEFEGEFAPELISP